MRGIKLGLAVALATAAGPSAIAQGGDAPAVGLTVGQTVSGELTPNDQQRRSGKFEDIYVIQGRRGQRIDLRLASDAFDPYLVVNGPEGFNLSNDDEAGGRGSLHSRLLLELPADGAYRVTATSFRGGETGAYRLSLVNPPSGVAITRPEPAQPIRVGAVVNGSLAAGDGQRGEGSYVDNYRFIARRGERVRIELSADKLDTVLTLRHPDGTEDLNDDTEGEGGRTSTNSRIDTVLAEDGEYVISASSYSPGETGPYRLTLAQSPGLPRQVGVQGGPRVIALLVGVSDYERTSDLANTDDDATELYEELRRSGMLHPASIVLTNSEATTKAVSDAFRRIAAAAGPNDLFVFLFSGHGDQVDVPVSAAELDGRAETIELYDAPMTDAQLAPLFANVRARMSMLVIDACYAGGFRSLVNRPNIIGMFSSEEDLTSLVASRFQAGGFLSYFLRAGITGEADDDGDRIVTAGELSTYVRRRFRREGDVPATTREDERNYQNILVERGGVHIDDVIVRLSAPIRSAAVSTVQSASLAIEEGGKPSVNEEGGKGKRRR
jgi:hypothetical protein